MTPEIEMVDIPDKDADNVNENVFPACAVTRSMNRLHSNSSKMEEGGVVNGTKGAIHSDIVDLQDTFMCRLSPDDAPSNVVSRDNLIEAQRNDELLIKLWDDTVPEEEVQEEASCFYVKNGVLMRKWRPPEAKPIDDWRVCHQIVMPKVYQNVILQLGHDNPLSGHMGIRKTYDRITKHFYWPQVRSDVEDYCRHCDICQRVGKINEKVPRAPLCPVPVLDEPFSDIVIDCVGPLPKTSRGNEYLLTIMCKTTRFPEAIPLRSIHSKKVVEGLEKFFCLVGFPRKIQSDLGSNFTSKEFKNKMKEWGVEHVTSSAYHPESQGVLERYHGTLKNMIKKFCEEFNKDWDTGVHLVLFASRDAVQESLGFSPFELVFGHEVRGPLKLLKEKWLEDSSSVDEHSIIDIGKFSYKLQRATEIAKENLSVAQQRMKVKYDKRKKVKFRKFSPGDKVLVLFPIVGNPLQAKFHGPYVVERKVSDTNYVISTPDRRKSRQLCHINMLKQYHGEDTGDVKYVGAIVGEDDNLDIDYSIRNIEEVAPKLKNSDVLYDIDKKVDHLDDAKSEQMGSLILEFSNLFPDVPSLTHVIEHDVVLTDSTPIKQHPYRVNPLKMKQMQEEIQYMLDNDLIEYSQSEWASPSLLVPKPDGSNRFVTDYRKVNAVTKTDPFPIPRIDSCIEKVGNSVYMTKLDLLKGYWQCGLTVRAKEVSAFVTPRGLYQYKRMPFGMKNSGSTFQRLVNRVIQHLENCEGYVDDLIMYHENWEDHMCGLRKLFERLREANLTVNLVKSEFGKATVQYLGHVVGQGRICPVSAKVEAIVDFLSPTGKKGIQRFLGMAGYYRKYCKNFSSVVSPLTDLLKKDAKFKWSDECEQAFCAVKKMLSSSPVLVMPRFDTQFKLMVDASDIGAGAVLLQEQPNGVEHPIAYYSKKFNKHEKNYSTIEKEGLALIIALQHFEVYLNPNIEPVLVLTDHNPLVFINRVKYQNRRILRWSLILQEYDLIIQHVSGKDNVISDLICFIIYDRSAIGCDNICLR